MRGDGLTFTRKEVDAMLRGRQPLGVAVAPKAVRMSAYKNTWEAAYAQLLALQLRVGLIRGWSYETDRLNIGEGAFYRPDFPVTLNDGTTEYREIKGYKREAAMVRIKAAAKQYPDCAFVMLSQKRGQWIEIGRWGKRP